MLVKPSLLIAVQNVFILYVCQPKYTAENYGSLVKHN